MSKSRCSRSNYLAVARDDEVGQLRFTSHHVDLERDYPQQISVIVLQGGDLLVVVAVNWVPKGSSAGLAGVGWSF